MIWCLVGVSIRSVNISLSCLLAILLFSSIRYKSSSSQLNAAATIGDVFVITIVEGFKEKEDEEEDDGEGDGKGLIAGLSS